MPSEAATKVTALPCPGCGARSSEPGYVGHASGCPLYYRIPGRESAATKARRYLVEGRLLVTTVTDRVVVARCRGDGEIYQLAGDPGGWSCNCLALTENCSHLIALRLVTIRP
jgi:hypothetical protein